MVTEPQEIHPKVSTIREKELSGQSQSCHWLSWGAYGGGGGPEYWKSAIIEPIFKKGGKEDRFVSLTSIPRKILEQITKQTICKPLEDNKKMSDSQHGFVSVVG